MGSGLGWGVEVDNNEITLDTDYESLKKKRFSSTFRSKFIFTSVKEFFTFS